MQFGVFCWKHKQAKRLEKTATTGKTFSAKFQLVNRSYVDFLVDFLAPWTLGSVKVLNSENKSFASRSERLNAWQVKKITMENMDFFYHCYQQTYIENASGHTGYLTQDFFTQIFQTMHQKKPLLIVEGQHGWAAYR